MTTEELDRFEKKIGASVLKGNTIDKICKDVKNGGILYANMKEAEEYKKLLTIAKKRVRRKEAEKYLIYSILTLLVLGQLFTWVLPKLIDYAAYGISIEMLLGRIIIPLGFYFFFVAALKFVQSIDI